MIAATRTTEVPEHILLYGVSWAYYERTLEELANQHVRVAYLDGMMELMSPLPQHDGIKTAIGTLIAFLAFQRGIRIKSFGSTTFRNEPKAAGSEPDESYYFGEIESVAGMERFDPGIHRAPDLWVEVDLFSPSVAREPIYARLGVPELWRYTEDGVVVRLLTPDATYVDSVSSKAFPFFPMNQFMGFVERMRREDETAVVRDFLQWVGSLPQ